MRKPWDDPEERKGPQHSFTDNGVIPEGKQACLLQNECRLWQKIQGFEAGKWYRVTYRENGRNNNRPQDRAILRVLLGEELVVSEHPVLAGESIGLHGLPYAKVASDPVKVKEEGPLTLLFETVADGGVTALIDDIQLQEVDPVEGEVLQKKRRPVFQDLTPDLTQEAVKRIRDDVPLSDQKNEGRWIPYAALSDEFEGKSLDASKWWDHNPHWLGRKPGYFYPGNVKVREGRLHLTMRRDEPPEMPKEKGYHTYTCAAVKSKSLVLYGYFEVKARPMRSHGSSSFWFYNSQEDWWTEIDVFELGGGAPGWKRKMNMNLHEFRAPTRSDHWSVGGSFVAPWDLADEEHVYGLEWDEEEIQFYLDGVLVRRGPNTHWHQPLSLNFDSETMPEWFGLPKEGDLPSNYSIDYVRSWKRQR